jgi:putative flavoprotein involved in K+ transport
VSPLYLFWYGACARKGIGSIPQLCREATPGGVGRRTNCAKQTIGLRKSDDSTGSCECLYRRTTVQQSEGKREQVVVVGGGPAGLAAAAAIQSTGREVLVLDRASEIGASWEAHYDRLHLHTLRQLSHLPGLNIPRREGRWVARDGVVRYLRDYAAHHGLQVRLHTTANSVHRDEDHWRIETDGDPITSDAVVIATGYNQEPVMPEWPGAATFEGELMHSSAYKSARPYMGKKVLVVGTGNSGAEIAVDLVEQHAATVWISVRTPPNILRRSLVGLPTQAIGIVLRRLPVTTVDRIAAVAQRVTVGDLSKYGMPPPPRGLYSRARNEERIPILDVGLIRAIKKRQVHIVPAVERFDGSEVVLEDGRRLAPNVVIAATGFRRLLQPLVGHLGVLDDRGNPTVHGPDTHPQAPNLHFIGYTNPISGNLRELAIDARRIARTLASSLRNTQVGSLREP